MTSPITLPNIREFVTSTVPEFLLVTVPAKCQWIREVIVKTFVNATPLQQKVSIAALAILVLALFVAVGVCVWNARRKAELEASFQNLDFNPPNSDNPFI